MARFVLFDQYNSFHDWGMILTAKEIPAAEPKTNYVTLDGAHGSIDLSEALTGEVHYADRTLAFSFSMSEGDYRQRDRVIRRVTTALHGRKVQIVEPDDPDHCYKGRVLIKSVSKGVAYAALEMEAICDPWRYALTPTVREVKVNGAVDVVFRNEGAKTVVPAITTAGSVFLSLEGRERPIELPRGLCVVPDLKLRTGVTVVRLSGSGQVEFKYTEADL